MPDGVRLPADLPVSLPEFHRQREAAIAKYTPLVKGLPTMEFLGLLEAVNEEFRRRNAKWNPGPGSRIGR